jgi:hypothetical protein
VVPGFGTFMIMHRAAELNKTTHILTPPSNEIGFDSSQQSDDAQLSGYLMRKLQLSRGEAAKAIGQFLKTAEDHLSAKGTLSLEGLGTITREKSGKILFIPDEEALKRANIFELPNLDISVVQPVFPKPAIERPIDRQAANRRNKRRWWMPAALIALIIGLSTLIYFSGIYENYRARDKTNTIGSETNDVGNRLVFGNRVTTDSNHEETDTLKGKISRELDKRIARKNALLYEETQHKSSGETGNTISESNKRPIIAPDKPYHIIAGAFLVPNNAERQKLQLERKGCSPVLLPKRGDYFMVSLGSYDSREQAASAMRQLRDKLEQELWVMKI